MTKTILFILYGGQTTVRAQLEPALSTGIISCFCNPVKGKNTIFKTFTYVRVLRLPLKTLDTELKRVYNLIISIKGATKMYNATIVLTSGERRVMEFQGIKPAKSFCGWKFNQPETQEVLVSDNSDGTVKLWLDKKTGKRISTR